ncbi:hypothetical protein BN159_8424 [Streptomyces davaonensis JCM 4913]|uniref:Tetratricopeptide repeat protein n=2 Tax=Streptomyces davaonensis TaxID=348043 RepID=K4RGF8_STRDJ|nr:hypothetical protein BN159_8424 [Streptomyces davaonensis JCM 4913]
MDRAVPLYEQALATADRELGENHPETLVARNQLAVAYGTMGRWQLALPLLEKTFSTCMAVLGKDHPTTRLVQSNLAAAQSPAKGWRFSTDEALIARIKNKDE